MKYDELRRQLREDEEYRAAEDELRPLLDLADEVLRLRMARGWSQEELAERTGTKQANISRIESGLGNPTVKFLQKLARALDTELAVRFQTRLRDCDSPTATPGASDTANNVIVVAPDRWARSTAAAYNQGATTTSTVQRMAR